MEDTEQRFLAEFIYESDAIEGIQDNFRTLMRQIREDKENGHVGAMLLLESLARGKADDRLISEELICRIQGLIVAEQHQKSGGNKLPEEWVGKYRKRNVWVGGRKCLSPESVFQAMNSWLGPVRYWQKKAVNWSLSQNLRHIADFHFYFEKIHPFMDGNGRTGRALVWYLFKCVGIKPFIFTSSDRHETYYLCFEDRKAMRRHFLKKMGFGIQTVPAQYKPLT